MSHWLIRQRYGHGAGRVCIVADSQRVTDPGFARAFRDAWNDGPRIQVRPAPVLATALSLALLVALLQVLQPSSDDIEIEMVAFVTAKAEPLPVPVPEPEPVVEPEPIPEPPKREPEPPPKPVAQPKPKPKPKPKPQIDSVAQVQPTVVPPQAVEPEPVIPEPLPEKRPVVQIDSVVAEAPPPPTPSFDRQRPEVVPAPTTPAPPLAVDPLRRESAPKIASRPVVRTKPLERTARHTAPIPSMVPAAAGLEEPNVPASPPVRVARSQPQKRPETRSRPDRLAVPAGVQQTQPATRKPAIIPRTARPVAPVTKSATGPTSDAPQGVPLGSLAACVSDQEEDRLKQRLLAAVTTQEDCVSAAGRYRFVETRNLNAFLMWVERASGRAEGDRCLELRHAIACLND